jgi:hypothetical protein
MRRDKRQERQRVSGDRDKNQRVRKSFGAIESAQAQKIENIKSVRDEKSG